MNDTFRDPDAKHRHIEVCLTRTVEYQRTTGFERFDFLNEALPEVSLAALDLSATLAGKPLRAPLMIAPMTGGTARGEAINCQLAAAAERFGLAFGVGSQRMALESPDSWRVDGAGEARRAVAMIEAGALFVHFNALQAAVQGGDRDFRDVALRLARLCRDLDADGIAVYAREVGFGISGAMARRLIDCGVAGIDCAFAGGTSWAKVEAYCARTVNARELGLRFGEWGIPASDSIAEIQRLVQQVLDERRICMFATGSANVAALRGKLRLRPAAFPA